MEKRVRPIDITGYLTPFDEDGQPICVCISNGGISGRMVVVFSTEEKLRASMEFIGHSDYKIKKVDDPLDFCESIWEQQCRVICDPRIVGENKTRWTEIVPPDNLN
jgi:hypothetical protein